MGGRGVHSHDHSIIILMDMGSDADMGQVE